MEQSAQNIPKNHRLIFLATQELANVPSEIQILPYGPVHSMKGDFLVDEAAMAALIQNAVQQVNDFVIDYEHQTLMDVQAPAAGWIKPISFMDRGPDGLWAKVDWTPKAQEYLGNREYRYFSPVILVRQSDMRAICFHSGALTNKPAVDGMVPIVNKSGTEVPNEKGDNKLQKWYKALLCKLGLAETATEDEVNMAVEALQPDKTAPVADHSVLTELGLPETATAEETVAKVKALKTPSVTTEQKPTPETTNSGNYATKDELKALKDELAKKDNDSLVSVALHEGKITPAQQDWAKDYITRDPEGFKKFLLTAPVVVPVGQRIAGGEPQKEAAIDELQMSVNTALGIDAETYKKGVAL